MYDVCDFERVSTWYLFRFRPDKKINDVPEKTKNENNKQNLQCIISYQRYVSSGGFVFQVGMNSL